MAMNKAQSIVNMLAALSPEQIAAAEEYAKGFLPVPIRKQVEAASRTDASSVLLRLWFATDFKADIKENNYRDGSIKTLFVPALNWLADELGREPKLADLTIDRVFQAKQVSDTRFRGLKTLWLYAHSQGIVSAEFVPDRPMADFFDFAPNQHSTRIFRRLVALLADALGREPLCSDFTDRNLSLVMARFKIAKKKERTKPLLKSEREIYAKVFAEHARWAGLEVNTQAGTNISLVGRKPIPRRLEQLATEIDGQLTLYGLFKSHYQPKRLLGKSQNTTRLYLCSLRKFGQYLGRDAMLTDLTDQAVGDYLQHLIDVGKLSMSSIEKEATQLLVLWRFAARRNMGPLWPEIQPPKAPESIPDSWTIEELQCLLAACRKQRGRIAGIPAGLYWETLVRLVLDCGERAGAVRKLEWTDLKDEWLTVRAATRKGGRKPKRFRLRASTLNLLAELRAASASTTIFPWDNSYTYFWTIYGRIVTQAGLPNNRRTKLHMLRRTVATLYEQAGGDATKLLGHSSRKVTEAYIDERYVQVPQACDLIQGIDQ
jgi:integrase